MITIEEIIKWSKPHPMAKYLGIGGGKGRMSRFGNKKIEFSIVGGDRGLYGDFNNTFEVAIIDLKTKNFVTNFFYPEGGEDIIGHMPAKKVEELVNSVIKRENLSVER